MKPTADDRTLVTRRRVLAGVGGTVALAGVGGFYISRSLEGDHGEYTAPEPQPVLSTRGSLAGSASRIVETGGEWGFGDAGELFVFGHGLNTDPTGARDQAYTARLGLEPVRPAPVIAYSWDSDTDWSAAKANATANGQPLAEWLLEWDGADGRPIHLLGYSLGARVCCETLRVLRNRDRGDVPASVSLLGGAIPDDSVLEDGRYGGAIAAVDGPVNNFHSENDRVLGWVYRIGDRNRAVGYGGAADPGSTPPGYDDVDVTDTVADHYSYFRPDVGCLPTVADRLE